jgi:hypothetical protein
MRKIPALGNRTVANKDHGKNRGAPGCAQYSVLQIKGPKWGCKTYKVTQNQDTKKKDKYGQY